MKPAEKRIPVVLIDDDHTIRQAISYLINESERFQVVDSYATVAEALKNIRTDNPRIILLDIELPGINGIEAIRKLKEQLTYVSILMLTVFEDRQKVFAALKEGATGYLTKDLSSEKIIHALEEVMAGGSPMSAPISKMVVSSFQKNTESPLTKRETEILEQIAEGKTRSRIAREMFIDLETVKSHLKNIYFKLSVHSRADAIKKAKKNQYI